MLLQFYYKYFQNHVRRLTEKGAFWVERGVHFPVILEWTCIAAVVLHLLFIGAVRISEARYAMNPDGTSYSDMAKLASAGEPWALVNGHWSPGLPMILTVFRWLKPPDIETLYPQIHHGVLITFCFAVISCAFMAMQVAAILNQKDNTKHGRWVVVFALMLFIFFANHIPWGVVSPDWLLAGSVFFALGIAVYFLRRGSHTPLQSFGLGTLAGVGFLSKLVFFHFSLLLVPLVLLVSCARGRSRAGAALVVGWFTVPLLFSMALSTKYEKLTIGEASNNGNIVMVLSRPAGTVPWHDSTQARGIPIHRPEPLLETPLIVAYGTLPGEPSNVFNPRGFDYTFYIMGLKNALSTWEILTTKSGIGSLRRHWGFLKKLPGAKEFLIGALGLIVIVGARSFNPQQLLILGLMAAPCLGCFFAIHSLSWYDHRFFFPFVLVAGFTFVLSWGLRATTEWRLTLALTLLFFLLSTYHITWKQTDKAFSDSPAKRGLSAGGCKGDLSRARRRLPELCA